MIAAHPRQALATGPAAVREGMMMGDARDDVIRLSSVPLSVRLKELAAKTCPEGMTNLELHVMGMEAGKLEAALAASEQARELAEDALHRACREIDARDAQDQQDPDLPGREERAASWARFYLDEATIARRVTALFFTPAPADAAGGDVAQVAGGEEATR